MVSLEHLGPLQAYKSKVLQFGAVKLNQMFFDRQGNKVMMQQSIIKRTVVNHLSTYRIGPCVIFYLKL